MTSKFVQSLIDIQKQCETRQDEFRSSWRKARQRLNQVFSEAAAGALEGAEVKPENGDTLALVWREQRLSFKANAQSWQVIRSTSAGEAKEEPYEPNALTKEKIEAEVTAFVCAVIGFDPEAEMARKFFQ